MTKGINLVLIALISISCKSQVDREGLIGEYVWNEGRPDTLRLNSDGTYLYWVTTDSDKVLKNSGEWNLNPEGNEVRFDDFSFLTDGYPKGIWYSRLRVTNNEIDLMYASEENIYFRKLKD